MHLVLCHVNADFDALGAAVGVTCLEPGSRLVLTGGTDPHVRQFLDLYRNEYPILDRRAVPVSQIRRLSVVDTQLRDRLGVSAPWLDLPHLEAIYLYDHHPAGGTDIPATHRQVEAVGATTTLIAEHLQRSSPSLTPAQATVMAIGIHIDTGSLTFEQTTARDAAALTWLLTQGADLTAIGRYVHGGLSPQLRQLLGLALGQFQPQLHHGHLIGTVLLELEQFVPNLAILASQLLSLTSSDALLLGAYYRGKAQPKLDVIGRSRISGTDLVAVFHPYGGGHPQAAACTIRTDQPAQVLEDLHAKLLHQIPPPPTAQDLMSSPVRTIRPDTTLREAHKILLRYGHSGLVVVDADDHLVGVISRRDLDLAQHHGLDHAPVKSYMSRQVKTITPQTPRPEIEALMIQHHIGRLPVLQGDRLVGIVTRTDLLRPASRPVQDTQPSSSYTPNLNLLQPQLLILLNQAAQAAKRRGWELYLVGGAVRDLLLAAPDRPLNLTDLDLVVDGQNTQNTNAALDIAQDLRQLYPQAKLEIHGEFQTVALLWGKSSDFGALWVDIATARTEFYPYPAANPLVEASSIRQDLYRRDFTVNALALSLTSTPLLLDFFGGRQDLIDRKIRVLHANSFIEDPTRICRAVRFAVRLGFTIEPQTRGYIRTSLASGVYPRALATQAKAPALQTRLKTELKYILQTNRAAIYLLGKLGGLQCLHPSLRFTRALARQLRLVDLLLSICDPGIPGWQVRLEVILAYLKPEYRIKVAKQLQLDQPSLKRLDQVDAIGAKLGQLGKLGHLPTSRVVQELQKYSLAVLILVAVGGERDQRRLIWLYLTKWLRVRSPLTGDDLKDLGYPPGKSYRLIIDQLLAATLDGQINDRPSAVAFLAEHYPLDQP